MKFVLIGYMGSGKSSVGKLLAELLDYEFIDLDATIEASEGMTIAGLFKEKGEIYFRRKEAAVLKELLETTAHQIIATGGGTPCYGSVMENILNLEYVSAVYLKCNLDTLTDRLYLERDKRPLISHIQTKELLNDFIRKHLFERSYYYNQAQIILNCDGLTEKEVAEKLVASLF